MFVRYGVLSCEVEFDDAFLIDFFVDDAVMHCASVHLRRYFRNPNTSTVSGRMYGVQYSKSTHPVDPTDMIKPRSMFPSPVPISSLTAGDSRLSRRWSTSMR
jgi:hypothetical protein